MFELHDFKCPVSFNVKNINTSLVMNWQLINYQGELTVDQSNIEFNTDPSLIRNTFTL